MRVRTLRDHYRYGTGEDPFISGSSHKIYEVSEAEARGLIAQGLVEAADADEADRGSGTGPSSGGTAESDGPKRTSARGKGRTGTDGDSSGGKGA